LQGDKRYLQRLFARQLPETALGGCKCSDAGSRSLTGIEL